MPKTPSLVAPPTKQETVMPPKYSSHKQMDHKGFNCNLENLLEFDLAVYPTERDQMLFVMQ
jgi:hypothetical protein